MNIYAQEILNRFGNKMLNNMLRQLPEGFQIIGSDDLTVVVGDKYKNVVFSRKTCKMVDQNIFETPSRINRKG